MRDIVVLAEDTAQITAGEKHAATAIVALQTGLFAEVRGDGVDEDVAADETVAGGFEAVDGAQARAEVAVAEVRVGEGSLAGGVSGGQEVVAGCVVVEEEGRGEVKGSAGVAGG